MPDNKTTHPTKERTISHDDALNLIRSVVRSNGTQLRAARELDISAAYLSDILSGKQAISDTVARKLGYRRVIVFKKEEEAHG